MVSDIIRNIFYIKLLINDTIKAVPSANLTPQNTDGTLSDGISGQIRPLRLRK